MNLRIFIPLCAILLIGCAAESNEPEEPPVTSEVEESVAPVMEEITMETMASQANDFAARFYGQVASGETGNLFFSPLSIHSALAMTFAGSRGQTAEQMREVLAFQGAPDALGEHQAYSELLDSLNDAPTVSFEVWNAEGPEMVERPAFDLVVANRLWGQVGFSWLQSFLDVTSNQYNASLAELDFQGDTEGARNSINEWIEETTHDRIQDLIPSGALDEATRLVLTNAIYFKANWVEEFPEHMTSDQTFHLANGGRISVPTMTRTDHYNYAEFDHGQILEMPYEQNALSMLVVLPSDEEGALSNTEQQLDAGELMADIDALERRRVEVWLPKFRLEQEIDLNEVLATMGMPIAFTESADFSGMTEEAQLMLTRALHKAFVAVDEKGTEAAAATAMIASLTSMPPPEETMIFRADRPFIFLIRHNPTGTILFMGRVMDPS